MTRKELIAERNRILKTPEGVARAVALRKVELAIGKIDRAAPAKPIDEAAVLRECERMAREVLGK